MTKHSPASQEREPDPDFLELLMQEVRRVAPSISEELAEQIKQTLIAKHAGTRFTLTKRKWLTPQQRRSIYDDSLTTMSDEEIKAKHRVSRATIYRLTKGVF